MSNYSDPGFDKEVWRFMQPNTRFQNLFCPDFDLVDGTIFETVVECADDLEAITDG